jgi:hypothetical protein
MKHRMAFAALAMFALSAGGYAEPTQMAQGGDGPPSVIIYEAGPSVMYRPVPPEPATNIAPSLAPVTDAASPVVDSAEPPPIIKADSPNDASAQPLPEPPVASTSASSEKILLPPPPQRSPHRSPPRPGKSAPVERVAAMPNQPPLPKPRPESTVDALQKPRPVPQTKSNIERLQH